MKIDKTTCRGRYTYFSRICVYMNITEPLPESIKLEYQGGYGNISLIMNIFLLYVENSMNMAILLKYSLSITPNNRKEGNQREEEAPQRRMMGQDGYE